MRLHIRLTLLIVVLAAVTGGTLALLVSEVMHNALEQEMEKRGVVIAQTMAEHVTHNVIDGEVVTAREALQEIIQRTEDVEFAYIVGFDGEVFAHSFEDGFPRALLPDKHDLIRGNTLHLERYSTQEGLGLLVGYPLIDGMKAHLHVGLNETYLHDQVESTRNQIVSVTLMVALVTALIGILLSRSITRPLEQLSASLRAFGEKQVEQQLDYRGGGREVADLARSFNHMIAERVRAEEALRLERDNLINILEAMEDGVYIVNQQYDIQYVNPVLQGDFGPFEGRKCYAYFHDREEVCPWCKNRDVFAGKTVQWEWYSSKNQRTYDLIDTPLRNADGSMSKLEIFRDITERKRAEETLRVSARQWQTTFDAISDSVCLIDLEGTILRSNEGTAKLLGKPLDEIIGATCWELVHGTSEPIAGCPIVRMQSSRRRETLALPVGDRWLNVTVDPLLDEEGSLIGGVHVIADITERVRAEEALREHREHLEKLVTERTVELDQRVAEVEHLNQGMFNLLEDLQAANERTSKTARQLEATNKDLEAFAYSVSHDLRAPLRHIDGFVQLLLKREQERLDPASSRYLNVIAQSSARMDQLIDDLLTFSRTGRAEMQIWRVELNELVREAQQELSPMLERRQITWEIGSLPAVQADPALLRQAWVNLLSNAIKFTGPRSEPRVEIGVKKPGFSEKSGFSEVTIFIRDNGVGFDPQYRHKLFGVFQRLHREDEFEGTGIGLATVRRIIHRHGGRVWAEGESDRGATFYFTLREAEGE